ncbi:hypothetical protein I5Q34_25325, partial [Streptomyces sp. AV19]|nr:hypothetical protein [Streptomyces sp. AV19]
VVAEDELNANYIIPSVFNARATEAVASAVKRAAAALQAAVLQDVE